MPANIRTLIGLALIIGACPECTPTKTVSVRTDPLPAPRMNPAYKTPGWGNPPIPEGGALVFLSKVDDDGNLFHPGTMSLAPTHWEAPAGPYYYEEPWLTVPSDQ